MLLTTKEVAALLRVHPKHVYRLMKRGLPAHRVGEEWRFDDAAALRWASGAKDGPPRDDAPAPTAETPPLVAGNGDVALEALLEAVRERGGALLGHVQADHALGLGLLRQGAVLAAGCHGDAAPAVPGEPMVWLHLAVRELGVAFERGKRVRRVSALIGKRLASRPPSAGIRARFDEALRREGLDPVASHAKASLHASHRDAVMAVARGEADFALASRAWAVRAGLGFLPFVAEGYGLALRATSLGAPQIAAVGECAQSAAYRRQLADGFGYDARRAGDVRFAPRAGSPDA